MKSIKNRILILVLLFIAAFAAYFIVSRRGSGSKKPNVLYTTLEEPSLPVVWIDTCGARMNCMRGYLSDTVPDIAADTLTILPEDRKLPVHIEDSSYRIQKISYEIRNEDLSELIEKTDVTEFSAQDSKADVTLPIENLVVPGAEYRLELTLTLADKGEVHYYSRLAFDEKNHAADMVALADGFSTRNFNYDSARENTTYIESSEAGDNTTYGRVTLKSNFSQLTYGDLHLSPTGPRDLRLTEYNGSMGIVSIHFMASSDGEDGSQELYEISESFSMRMGPERIYMMDYSRSMHEVFMGNTGMITNGRIVLGISEEGNFQSVKSKDGNFTAFVSARDLWLMDGAKERCVNVYSFRSGKDSGIRSNFEKHQIRILSCEADGSTDFLLYGYMSRGPHEGQTGIALMRYDAAKNVVAEQTFLPLAESYEEIDADMKQLSYLGANGMLYLKIGNGFYGLDTKSNESVVITDTLREGNYAVSSNGSRIAWQETEDASGSGTVHFMNLDTGSNKELKSDEGQLLKPIGFIDLDLAVGIGDADNVWNINGIDREIPFTAIEIVDDSLTSQKHYEKQGNFLSHVYVADNRIHLSIVKRTDTHAFAKNGEDTIVCNVPAEDSGTVSYYTAKDTEKTWFIPLADSVRGKSVKTVTPGAVDYTGATVLSPVQSTDGGRTYYAYGHGSLLGIYGTFGRAVNAAYGEMGIVRTGGRLVYCRAATSGIRTLKDPGKTAKELMDKRTQGTLSDLYGTSLREVLYFVSRGMTVLGYSDAGDPVLIYAYDRNEVSLYDVGAGSYRKMSLSEAETMFDSGHNDFSCDFTSS